MKTIFRMTLVGLAVAVISGCQSKESPEGPAQACLAEARVALGNGDFAKAKQCVEQMRKDYPKAFNAREDGILLLDSINLAEAKVELQGWMEMLQQPDLDRIAKDTLDFNRDEADQKVKFFEKKITIDQSKKKKW